jgi:hypothetical protein
MNTIAQMQKTIPVSSFRFSNPSSWTEGALTGVRNRAVHTPTAEQSFITIPLDGLEMQYTQYGFRIQSIIVPYLMDVAAPTAGLNHGFFRIDQDAGITGASGAVPSQATLSSSLQSTFQQGQTTVTNTNISTLGQAMIITPISAAWLNENGSLNYRSYALQVSVTTAATTTLSLYSATVRYELAIG